jgi:hypothetical protein
MPALCSALDLIVPSQSSDPFPQPNPARMDEGFTVRLRLPTASEVDLRLHDVTGPVVTWKRERVDAGDSTIRWSPRVPRSGLFLLRARTSGGLGGEAKILSMP